MLACDAFKLDAASRWQVREVTFDLTINASTRMPEQGAELTVDAIASVNLSDEVENCETFLFRSMSKPSPELLEKYGEAFCRPKEEN
jgi:hypothetical protein